MDEDIDALGERIERLIESARQLTDENVRLRAELAESRQRCEQLSQRMRDARAKVEAALARLPLAADA